LVAAIGGTMNKAIILEVEAEAKRLLDRVKKLKETSQFKEDFMMGSEESAAVYTPARPIRKAPGSTV
jgi:hypothetical protein